VQVIASIPASVCHSSGDYRDIVYWFSPRDYRMDVTAPGAAEILARFVDRKYPRHDQSGPLEDDGLQSILCVGYGLLRATLAAPQVVRPASRDETLHAFCSTRTTYFGLHT